MCTICNATAVPEAIVSFLSWTTVLDGKCLGFSLMPPARSKDGGGCIDDITVISWVWVQAVPVIATELCASLITLSDIY